MKRVLRYIRGTTELGLFYKRESEENLVAFCDSDYAGDLEDRKSTSGHVFKMSNRLVAWSSKKQSMVTEAGFISTTVCAAQSIWMMCVLERLEIKQSKCIIFCDNSQRLNFRRILLCMVRVSIFTFDFTFFVRLANQGEVHCRTKDQLVDIMTKALNREVFVKLRERLGMCSIEEIN